MIGTLIGGILVGLLSEKMSSNRFSTLFLITPLVLLPIAGTFIVNLKPILSYIIIVCSTVLIMVIVTMFNIMIMAFIQKETPLEMIGKIIAFISTIGMCALPLGQLMYGCLFDVMMDKIYYIIFMAVFISMFITFTSRRVFKLIC